MVLFSLEGAEIRRDAEVWQPSCIHAGVDELAARGEAEQRGVNQAAIGIPSPRCLIQIETQKICAGSSRSAIPRIVLRIGIADVLCTRQGHVVAEKVFFTRTNRITEAVIDPVAERRIVDQCYAARVAVLVEALVRITKRDGIGDAVVLHFAIAAQFEAIAVTGEAAVVPVIDAVAEGHALLDHHGLRTVESIPAIIRIFPGAATVKKVAGPLQLLGGEAVCHAAVLLWVVVTIRVGIDHGGVGTALVDLQSAVAVVIEGTVLESIVRAGDVGTLITGTGDCDALEIPVATGEGEAEGILNPGLVREGEVNHGLSAVGGHQVNLGVGVTGLRQGDGVLRACRVRHGIRAGLQQNHLPCTDRREGRIEAHG